MTTTIMTMTELRGGVSPVRATEINHVFSGPVYRGNLVVVRSEMWDGSPNAGLRNGEIVVNDGVGDSAATTSVYRVVEVGEAYLAAIVTDDREHWYRTARVELLYQSTCQ